VSEDDRQLRKRLALHFSSLSAKQQVVARSLADDPDSIVYSSVEAFGRKIDVDAATVVRTCQKLGFRGWSELRDEARRSLQSRQTFAERAEAMGADGVDVIARIFEIAAANVTRTHEDLAPGSLEAVATTLARANTVAVVADGVSHGAGVFLASSLQLVGLRSVLVAGSGQAGPMLASLRPDDALVAISVWRYLRSTVQAAEIAHERGLDVVAITDSHVAPVALTADQVLVARTACGGPRLSLAGMMGLTEALIACVAAVDPKRTREATQAASRLYYDGNVVAGHPGTDVGHFLQGQPDDDGPDGESDPDV
jgi:RpiR family transcriptional regulator, carbohydrate utilization regulator